MAVRFGLQVKLDGRVAAITRIETIRFEPMRNWAASARTDGGPELKSVSAFSHAELGQPDWTHHNRRVHTKSPTCGHLLPHVGSRIPVRRQCE